MSDNYVFNRRAPHILLVDNFYKDPDNIRSYANSLKFGENLKYYKGLRSESRFLLPYIKEEFERLLNIQIIDWLKQNANGLFQKTLKKDPLVFHSDGQDYAAAIYLTPDLPLNMGTSFWRHKGTGCRRPPNHILENKNINASSIYNENTILNQNAWELVDRVGAIYNRLVIWDAKLIHSASEYSEETERLVQLFFFNVKR